MLIDSVKRVLVQLGAGAALGAALLTVIMPLDFFLAWGRWPGGPIVDGVTAAMGAGIGAVVALAKLRAVYASVVGFIAVAAPLFYLQWMTLRSRGEPMMPTKIGIYALGGAAAAALCAVLLRRLLSPGEPAAAPQARPTMGGPTIVPRPNDHS